jgi:translation elongation factor EF-Tu-like GTPase
MDAAEVGDNVGVLIKGVKKDEIRRGFVLTAPGVIKPYKKFSAKVMFFLLKKEVEKNLLLIILSLSFFLEQQMLQV